jgi:hypothetical protein
LPFDTYYTPPDVADTLLSFAKAIRPKNVADFAAGSGSLLRAATNRWAKTNTYANDIDLDAVKRLRRTRGVNTVDGCDFLANDYLAKSSLNNGQKFRVILLNPPFSGRWFVSTKPLGISGFIKCSRSMSFVISALGYLSRNGELLAILPTSLLHSKLDAKARALLAERFNFSVELSSSYGCFPTADASVCMVRIVRRRPTSSILKKSDGNEEKLPWTIRRGQLSVCRQERTIAKDGSGFVHTTSICSGKIKERYQFDGSHRMVPRGSILVPRVGSLKMDKVLELKKSEYISDCLLAIYAKDKTVRAQIMLAIKSNFSHFQSLYAGTSAPFITHARLNSFLVDTLPVIGAI